jgi:hypothetical protein
MNRAPPLAALLLGGAIAAGCGSPPGRCRFIPSRSNNGGRYSVALDKSLRSYWLFLGARSRG